MGRKFYEDDELVTTKPGINTAISAELEAKESGHGNVSYVDGMGIRTTPYLEKQANIFRLYVHEKATLISAELATQKTALANEWAILKAHVDATILDPVFPGVVNFLFPVLATNVFVARRALPLRFLASTIAAGVSLKYNMPLTYEASKSRLCVWERENFPELHKQKNELVESAEVWLKDAKVLREQTKVDLQKLVHDARLAVVKALDDE